MKCVHTVELYTNQTITNCNSYMCPFLTIFFCAIICGNILLKKHKVTQALQFGMFANMVAPRASDLFPAVFHCY